MKYLKTALHAAFVGVILAGTALALRPETRLEVDFTPLSELERSSTASSTFTLTAQNGSSPIMGFSYAILAIGDDPDWTVHCTTKTYQKSQDLPPAVSSSPVHRGLVGVEFNDVFETGCEDPKIITHGLATSATVYVWMKGGQRRTP